MNGSGNEKPLFSDPHQPADNPASWVPSGGLAAVFLRHDPEWPTVEPEGDDPDVWIGSWREPGDSPILAALLAEPVQAEEAQAA